VRLCQRKRLAPLPMRYLQKVLCRQQAMGLVGEAAEQDTGKRIR